MSSLYSKIKKIRDLHDLECEDPFDITPEECQLRTARACTGLFIPSRAGQTSCIFCSNNVNNRLS